MGEKPKLSRSFKAASETMSYKLHTDEQLLQLFIANQDEDAFSTVYQRYFTSLCKYLAFMGSETSECQDIVQDVFLKIYRNPELYNRGNNVKVWLLTCVKHRWFNHRRNMMTRARHTNQGLSMDVISVDIIEDRSLKDERLKKIDLAVRDLKDSHRETFILKYSNNLKIAEIAEVMDCSEGTVKSRLFYALKNLRSKIR